MTNAFAFPCQKVLKKHSDDPEIAAIIKDIENAKQGVMTFSKEVKKYMLQFIHARTTTTKRSMRSSTCLNIGANTSLSVFSKFSNFKTSVIFGTTFCTRTERGRLSAKLMVLRTKTTL